MIPPLDFRLKTDTKFPVSYHEWSNGRGRKFATVAELKDESLWIPHKTYVSINGEKYLREAVLLQCADTKKVIEQLEKWSPDVTYLAHLKFKSVMRDTLNNATILKFHDRVGRQVGYTILDSDSGEDLCFRYSNMLQFDDCYVFETKSANTTVHFLYNTTTAVRFGKPTWLA